MKRIGTLLFFVLGVISTVFSQEKSEQKDSLNLNGPGFGDQFSQNNPFELKTPPSLLIDSTHVFVPRSLYTERLLSLPKETKFRVGLPLFELPDPQSRMPIREFDDSVNYTILKKDY